MMKKIVISILGCFILSNVAVAALPPTAESLRRMKAVIDSTEVYDKLGSANWVESIEGDGEKYLLKTKSCQLEVKVIPVHSTERPAFVGPTPLTVKVGNLQCQ